ncbi:hypothetical protein [Gottfriedia acidiceleris]|uniref:hypothetical protein n=1 Tax=Gottfriedia acidiceleris TaxID=371036 RepID=UPI000B434D6D|nr:hypothetical protein [Gottfriedia acidiceleris]
MKNKLKCYLSNVSKLSSYKFNAYNNQMNSNFELFLMPIFIPIVSTVMIRIYFSVGIADLFFHKMVLLE